MSVEIAQKYINAVQSKDFDGAMMFLTDDAELETPIMGTKRGKEKIKGTLKMISKMGGGNLSQAEDKNGTIVAFGSGQMGKMILSFGFEGDKINWMSVQRI